MAFVLINGLWRDVDTGDGEMLRLGSMPLIKQFVFAKGLEPGDPEDDDYQERLDDRRGRTYLVFESKSFVRYDHTGLNFSTLQIEKPLLYVQEDRAENNLTLMSISGNSYDVIPPTSSAPFDTSATKNLGWSENAVNAISVRNSGRLLELGGIYRNIPDSGNFSFLTGKIAIDRTRDKIFYFRPPSGTVEDLTQYGSSPPLLLDEYQGKQRLGLYREGEVFHIAELLRTYQHGETARTRIRLRVNSIVHCDHQQGSVLPAFTDSADGDQLRYVNISDETQNITVDEEDGISNTRQETGMRVAVAPGASCLFWKVGDSGILPEHWWFEEIPGRAYFEADASEVTYDDWAMYVDKAMYTDDAMYEGAA